MIQHPYENTIINLDQVVEVYVYVQELVFLFASNGIEDEHWLFPNHDSANNAFEHIVMGLKDRESFIKLHT